MTSFHAYMDSQRTAALEHLARHGVEETRAPQIVS
ncbi:MAG: hypothetical protein AVDCRST_MAG12-115 [uncultured Rubrobacteraceae bacterium]|uniref:Uncharacterized protein n=1 Tax=uncultured Rubrobacteraceae bacterium TaxID=349277 RepID=A0A6J4R4V4_9ACTN|nr:MAG: hypothetical protein AVDCRST_MAG12-115 [uncultured Rubrobacteraceae bacterium]